MILHVSYCILCNVLEKFSSSIKINKSVVDWYILIIYPMYRFIYIPYGLKEVTHLQLTENKGGSSMIKSLKKSVMLCLLLVACFGCSTTTGMATADKSGAQILPLRVGITPDFPPVIFKQAGKLAGVEVDFADLLSRELGRQVKFVELKRDDQISALLEGRTDIIMSGMSVTEPREIRIDFTSP